jgi:dTDP-glucose 4,6-dehydratase/UDP-glucose 4-epimerase
MKILITGHKGFIGSHLYNLISGGKHEIIGIDLQDGDDLLTCDLPEADMIIHLAGKSGVRESMEDPAAYWRNNVEVSKRIFDRYHDKRILWASSSSAYEPHLNPYAASKFVIEEAAACNIDILGMRFHTVYSSTPRKGMFLQKLIDDELEYVTTHYRDFVHIDDLCTGIVLCLWSDITGELDIGSGVPVKIRDLAPDLPIRLNTPNEREYTCANLEIINTLGYKPKYNIENFLTNKDLDNIIYI